VTLFAADRAFAAERHAASRISVGHEIGLLIPSPTSIDGELQTREDGDFYIGITTGYSHALGDPRYGIVLLNRFATADSAWSRQRGENRYRIDLAIGPELRLPIRERRPFSEWYFNLPIGPSLSSNRPGPGRAVREDYSAGYGFNVGLNGGVGVAGAQNGGTIGGGYLLHVQWLEHTARLSANPDSARRQRMRTLDHVIMMTFGYAFWL
jgi:hypothetical protein